MRRSPLTKKRARSAFFYGVGLTLYAALIYLTGAEAFWAALKRLSTFVVLQILALDLCFYVVKTVRWKVILKLIGVDAGYSEALAATLMGYMASTILPVRLGELYRCYALKKFNPNAALSKTLSSIVVEGVLDAVVILSLFTFSIIAMKATQLAPFITLMALTLGVVIASTWMFRSRVVGLGALRRLLRKVSASWARRVEAFLSSFADGLNMAFSSVTVCGVLFGLSFYAWSVSLTYSWFVLENLGFHIVPVKLIAGMTAFQLSLALPAPPGYLGSFEAYWSVIYTALGLKFMESLRLGVSYHFVSVLGSLTLGGVGLLVSRLAPMLKRVVDKSAFKDGLKLTPLT